MENKVEEKLRNIMSAIFNVNSNTIDNNSSPNNLQNWDSLKHMQLVLAIEDEFEISISDEEILKMNDFSLIKNIIFDKLQS
jgi:acyl carrier protein